MQLPLDLSELSTPEPDLAVVVARAEDYAAAHPAHALLVVEVADDSVIQDRLTKGPMYAAAGIGEYWLVNLRARCVEVYRDPQRTERRYADARVLRSPALLDVVALPGASLAVDEVLPPL